MAPPLPPACAPRAPRPAAWSLGWWVLVVGLVPVVWGLGALACGPQASGPTGAAGTAAAAAVPGGELAFAPAAETLAQEPSEPGAEGLPGPEPELHPGDRPPEITAPATPPRPSTGRSDVDDEGPWRRVRRSRAPPMLA
ncbi:MAG: hypothetical protein KF830_07040 [Planctomycetes bacterium]|nr:hypothetical protein [Planctomycetota bacterium]